ncbi:RDD family protein [Rhabdothermincola sp. EGI L10124]|nr:RDD family protein [Rhabdothermincola salaria]
MVDLFIVFFAQLTFMVLGGSALVGPDGARYLFAVLLTGYELVFVARLGQTPAKDWLDVKVAAHPGTDTPGLARAVRRWLLVLVVLLVPNPWVAGAVLVALALPTLVGSGRGLHDLVAGTWVIAYDADEHEEQPDVDFERLDRLRKERRLFRFRAEDDPPT